MFKSTKGLSKYALFSFLTLIVLAMFYSCDDDAVDPDGSFETITTYLRDWQYLDGKIYDLGRLGGDIVDFDTLAGDEKSEIKVYRGVQTTIGDPIGIEAHMYVDPDDTGFAANETEFCIVEEVNPDEYYVDLDNFWIMFDVPNAGIYDCALGIWIVVERGDGTTDTIGNISEEPYNLKLIKSRSPIPFNVTFDYAWRNVYSISEDLFDLNNLDIKIYKGPTGTEDGADNPDHNDEGVLFITLLELDRIDKYGNPNPDSVIDKYTGIIIPQEKILIFPGREPFDNPALDEPVPEIYENLYSATQVLEASKYYLEIVEVLLPIPGK